MTITGQIGTAIAGKGFVIRRGTHSGELDAAGVVWLTVKLARRDPRDTELERRVGVHCSKFSYLEDSSTAVVVNARAAITEQIRAADRIRAEREALEADDGEEEEIPEADEEEAPPPPAKKRKPGRPRK